MRGGWEMYYSVILPCAGVGSRMQLGYNKLLFMMKNGKCVLENTVQVFLEDEKCQEIILVVGRHDQSTIEKMFHDSRIQIALGGATRQESVAHGLQLVQSENVLIHDGARPFLTPKAIDDLLDCLEENEACLLMVPSKDTVKIVQDGQVVATPSREMIYQAQTPQAFRTRVLKEAFEKAQAVHFIGTDDASIVENFSNVPVKVVLGDYHNIKITTLEDLVHDK